MRHRVVVLALDGVLPFELGIPQRIFGRSTSTGPDGRGEKLYDVVTCSVRPPGPVRTDADFSIVVEHGPEALATAGTVVVPASYELGPVYEEGRLTAELAAAFAHVRPGTRVVSICTGSYVLAAAGYLDGRPATTHWSSADHFQRLFPKVRVDPDVLFIDDGDVLTSAGVAAGIDLCLHIVRRDHGTAVANDVARRTVVPPAPRRRPGTVHPAPAARGGGRHDDGRTHLGARAARRTDPAARHGAAGVDERTHLHPALPRGGGPHPGAVARPAAGRAGTAPAGVHGPVDRPGGTGRGIRHGHLPASARAGRAGRVAHGLPADVPVGGAPGGGSPQRRAGSPDCSWTAGMITGPPRSISHQIRLPAPSGCQPQRSARPSTSSRPRPLVSSPSA